MDALDAGLLVLRLGAGAILVVLLAWGDFPNASVTGISAHPMAATAVITLGVLAGCGLATRPTALLLTAGMVGSTVAGWLEGQEIREEPVRALMLAVLYATLALTGPGKWAVKAWGGPPGTDRVSTAPAPERLVPKLPASIDAGLLVLRLGTGVSLFLLFGVTKLGWILDLIQNPNGWSNWAFPQLIATVGFPAPVVLAFCAILNETVTPLLVASGAMARAAAVLGAVGMTGALYTSIRIEEEPLRAALYVVAFGTLALTGPGRFSVTGWQVTARRQRIV